MTSHEHEPRRARDMIPITGIEQVLGPVLVRSMAGFDVATTGKGRRGAATCAFGDPSAAV